MNTPLNPAGGSERISHLAHKRSHKLDWKQHLRSESAQQARLPLDQGTELSAHETQSPRDSGQELRTIQYWFAFIIHPVRHPRRCHRQKSTHPIQQYRPNFTARPPLNSRYGTHSTLSGAFPVLPHWMKRQGCEHASHDVKFSQLQSSTHELLLEPTMT